MGHCRLTWQPPILASSGPPVFTTGEQQPGGGLNPSMYSGQRLLGGASSAAASVAIDVSLAAKLRMGTWLLPEDRFGRAYEIAGRLRGSDMSYKRFSFVRCRGVCGFGLRAFGCRRSSGRSTHITGRAICA